jgi:HdeA/HdeB family
MTFFIRMPRIGLALTMIAAPLMLAAPIIVAPLPVLAQSAGTDITRISCGQLTDMQRGEQEQLLTWLYGYYAGAAQKAVIDRGAFLNSAKSVSEFCGKQKSVSLISAQIREIFIPGGKSTGTGSADSGLARGPSSNEALISTVPGASGEGVQRLLVPQAGALDPATTSGIPRQGAGNASQPLLPLIDSLIQQQQSVPSRPTPQ